MDIPGKKILAFLLPLIGVVVFPFILFFTSGELLPAKRIVQIARSDTPMLLGKVLPLQGEDDAFKIMMIHAKRPAVIALGNSRVLQIRESFFKDKSFYNGGGIATIKEFKETIEKFDDEEKPDLIIIGLEQSYFSSFHDTNEIPDLALENKQTDFFVRILTAWRNVYFSILNGKYSVTQLFLRTHDATIRIGLQANIKNAGIRNDGSYDYGEIFSIRDKRNEDYQFKDSLRRMEKGVNLFYHGDKISKHSVSLLQEFLAYCEARNIHVIGFLPPYAQEIHDRMKTSGEYQYVFALGEKLKPLFEQHGYSFFDFSDMSSFGANPNEIIDGLHASETAYRKLFATMAKKDHRLKSYAADTDTLSSPPSSLTSRY